MVHSCRPCLPPPASAPTAAARPRPAPAVCERVGSPAGEALLEPFKPRPYTERVGGKTMAQAGCVPILHMRGFQKGGALPDALVADITGRHAA